MCHALIVFDNIKIHLTHYNKLKLENWKLYGIVFSFVQKL